MKILMLADPNEPHVIKWANALEKKGQEVVLFSFNPGDRSLYPPDSEITFYHCGMDAGLITGRPGSLSKLQYLKVLPRLRKVIRHHRPDLLHAHYAAGYGLTGALSGFRPFVVSAWGSDVIHFPTISPLHRMMMRFVLKKADAVLGTSRFMAAHIKELAGITARITPFGVDTGIFYNRQESGNFQADQNGSSPAGDQVLTIGTVKKMKPEYNLTDLLDAFHHLRQMVGGRPLRLLLVGDGPERHRLEQRVKDMRLSDCVHFTGYIPWSDTPAYHNMIDIYANVSLAESFGVSVLEASACGRPVVAPDLGGLREVVRHDHTGYLVAPGDSKATARALNRLVGDPLLRHEMGQAGQRWVRTHYSMEASTEKMLSVYREMIS